MTLPQPRESQNDAVEREVLDIVSHLVSELGGEPGGRRVLLDDALERDLGLGSLERVELLVRLEEAFHVQLPDAVMAEAECPRDLVVALLSAAPMAPPETAPRVYAPLAAPAAVPVGARTLTEVLRWYAERTPERAHVFLREDDGGERTITYRALAEQAARVAVGLRAQGIGPGERVALMLRTEAGFFFAFFGTLLAGGVPVPIYPPFRADRIEEYARRQVGILHNADARLLVTFDEAERVADLFRRRVPCLTAVTSVTRLSVADGDALAPSLTADAPALIQYTSGSTGEPKGVLLTHANLLANIRGIEQAIAIDIHDVGVSWLPLYHDMGLIGSWLGALYFGVPIAILSPLAFLSRPARWLHAIHAHRATVSPAPNFAFDLCVRKVRDDELTGVDLSCWRLALNGSEAVSPETIDRFTRRFAPYGFRPEAMCPVYGLAESAVALTVPPIPRLPRIDTIDRERFEQARDAQPVGADATAPLRFVSCGYPLPGHEIRVVDGHGRVLGERLEGRIEFRGPSVTSGYFRNPELTRSVQHDGWMDSGDLGYVADGELFITGRRKDVIIKAGRNLYPQEVEELVGELPGIRKGCVAAFGVHDPAIGTERLVVVAETRERAPARRAALQAAARDCVMAALGIPADAVLICAPGTVLKTSSGKIRRGATRDAYLRGDVPRRRRSARVQWLRLLAGDFRLRLQHLLAAARLGLHGLWLALLLAVALPPLWLLALLLPGSARVEHTVRGWCRVLLALGGVRLEASGLAQLPPTGAAVLVANHESYLDAVVLLAMLPANVRFVAKRELLDTPLIGTIIRRAGHLPVERADLSRSVADADRASFLLRRGRALCFFPEGTFRRAPGLMPFRLGAFKAAVETGSVVIPLAIRGTRAILPADAWIPRPGRVLLTVGASLTPTAEGWPEIVRLRDAARAMIAAACGEPVLLRRPRPD